MKVGEGVLIQELNTIRVECLPGDILPSVEIDLSQLANLHDSVSAGDLYLGESVEILNSPDEVIVRVVPVAVEKAEEEEELEEGVEEEPAEPEAAAEGEQEAEE